MANVSDFIVKSGLVVKANTTIPSTGNLVTTNTVRTSARPALDLNFVRSDKLDPRINFARASNATSIGVDGTIKPVGINQPRFDYDNQSRQNFGLLLEPSRTNLLSIGSAPIPSGQVATGNILSSSTEISYLERNSVINKHVRYPTSTGDNNMGYHGVTIPGSTVHAISTYVWIPSATTVTSVGLTSDGVAFTQFNADLTKRDQWQRIYTTATTTASQFIIGVLRPNGMTDGGVIYSTCWQIEAGTYPTSYIPTFTASVTRAADAVSISGANFNNFYKQGAGTLYVESIQNGPRTSGGSFTAALYNASTDYIGIQYVGGNGSYGGACFIVRDNASYTTNGSTLGNAIFGTINKSAVGFDSSGASLFETGIQQLFVTAFTGIPNVTQLSIGSRDGLGTSFPATGTIRRITYWPKRLANTELAIITTP